MVPPILRIHRFRLLVPLGQVPDPCSEGLGANHNSQGRHSQTGGISRVHAPHPPEKWVSRSYRAGLRHALDLGAGLPSQMDADFSHSPNPACGGRATIDVRVALSNQSRILALDRILISHFGSQDVRFVSEPPLTDASALWAARDAHSSGSASHASAQTAMPFRSS